MYRKNIIFSYTILTQNRNGDRFKHLEAMQHAPGPTKKSTGATRFRKELP
jgi:hypothetical protein